LKQTMGFSGFVMSDWAATHTPGAVNAGLDEEMPGSLVPQSLAKAFAGDFLKFSDEALNDPAREAAVNASALRVLTSIYRLRLDECSDCCTPPDCIKELTSVQTSAAHGALARSAAAGSTVLLKNDGILPLNAQRTKRIAVLGKAAKNTYYFSSQGSSHVEASSTLTLLEAIKARAGQVGIDVVSRCDRVDLAACADVAVVVGGAFTTESLDRKSLSLGDHADAMIAEVALQIPTIAVLLTPGAVLTPWREEAAAIMTLFFGGDETGGAIASLLFGDESPSGKLPVMFPASQKDVIWPSWMPNINYAEGIFTSYRSPTFKAAFPFGHGLSYTSFNYSNLEPIGVDSSDCLADEGAKCIQLTIKNVGSSPGAEVVQAYLEFPAHLEMPEKMLRGFQKTRLLQPGEEERLTLSFSPRDLSVYMVGQGRVPQTSGVRAHVGSSSADIRGVIAL